MTDMYILLPVFNRILTTEAYLKLLLSQTFQDWKVILVDDNSSDGTADMFERLLGEKGHVVKTLGNSWWAGGLQAGLNYLKTLNLSNDSIVYICNDDITYETHFLEKAVLHLKSLQNSLLSSWEYDKKSNEIICSGVKVNWYKFSFSFNNNLDPDCFSTRSIFIKYGNLKQMGDFHTFFLPHYFSDYEYTYRAKSLGISLVSAENLKVYVDTGSSGVHGHHYELPFIQFLKLMFSKRSAVNPFYKICFVLLACPEWRMKLRATSIVLKSFIFSIGKWYMLRLGLKRSSSKRK